MPPEPEPRRRRWLFAALLLLLLLIGVGTYGNVKARGRVARVQQLQQELFSKQGSPDDRKAKADQLRNEMQRLTPEQRNELFAAGQQKAVERMDRYFAMSPREKQQFLDDAINRDEQRRKERAANGAPPPNANRPPRNTQPQSAEQIEQRRKERLNRTTPEQRATMDRLREQMDKFRDEMNRRRQQRGLAPAGGPGGFGPPR